jgi:glutamate synthase domain-containing protein 3
VYGNAQEQVANTMNSGKIVIHGDASDVVGYGMRGGRVFVRGDVGYRVGIHMKEFRNQVPAIVIGETAGDFLGEYMAGGILLVLGLSCDEEEKLVGDWTGTGMHGGMIVTRKFPVPEHKLGREPSQAELTEQEMKKIETLVREFCEDFSLKAEEVLDAPFFKYVPLTHRPYGKLYAPQR